MNSPSGSLGVSSNPEEPVLILHITGVDAHHISLRGILQLPDWRLHHIRHYREARKFLMSAPVAIVLSDAVLSDGDWRGLLQETRRLAEPPPLVVASRLADERLWAEVLNLGGHDVLAMPFDAHEVRRVMESAVRASGYYKMCCATA
jgi:DNA-binding response OmpR family regulator